MTKLPRSDLPFRSADFPTLIEALDYAAKADTGLNFYNSRGILAAELSYKDLRSRAISIARKLLHLGFTSGQRVALVAETTPDFAVYLFACQYAGLIPVPLPAMLKLGAHSAFVAQLKNLLWACDASLAIASDGYVAFLEEVSQEKVDCRVGTYGEFNALPEVGEQTLPRIDPQEIAYIQYTSGSTRFPKGVVITHRNAMSNLAGIVRHGVQITPADRMMSWLPFYHDMGLVGFLLVPMSSQISVDYLATHDFAMRPRLWLSVMTETRASISFSPCFGYDLCARRLRDGEASRYDLSNWRIAGIGGEMIRPKSLELFAQKLAPAGFDEKAFTACYGMAECTLGISFSPLDSSYTTDYVDMGRLTESNQIVLLNEHTEVSYGRHLVNCGYPLPSFEVQIRGPMGEVLDDYRTGEIHLRGPSITSGYFNLLDEEQPVSKDGWLDTGDIGYMANGLLTVTGRKKDLIIIRGRNIWPQDLEHVCETQPEIRPGDAVAFSIGFDDEDEACVVLVESKQTDEVKRRLLTQRLTKLLREELSLDCHVELVPHRSLPVTSSGKLSRSKARLEYLDGDLGNVRTLRPSIPVMDEELHHIELMPASAGSN